MHCRRPARHTTELRVATAPKDLTGAGRGTGLCARQPARRPCSTPHKARHALAVRLVPEPSILDPQVRSNAFLEVGGSPTWTLTEDYALGMELKKFGWHCRYVQEYLAIGEAPEQIRNCYQQRSRWCKARARLPAWWLGAPASAVSGAAAGAGPAASCISARYTVLPKVVANSKQNCLPLASFLLLVRSDARCSKTCTVGWSSQPHAPQTALNPRFRQVAHCPQVTEAGQRVQGHFQIMFSGHNPMLQKRLSWYMRIFYMSGVWSYIVGATASPLFIIIPVVTVWFGVFPIVVSWWAALGLTVYYVCTNMVLYYVRRRAAPLHAAALPCCAAGLRPAGLHRSRGAPTIQCASTVALQCIRLRAGCCPAWRLSVCAAWSGSAEPCAAFTMLPCRPRCRACCCPVADPGAAPCSLKHIEALWFSNVANSLMWWTYVKAFWRAANSICGGAIQFKTTIKGASALMNTALRDLAMPIVAFGLLASAIIAGCIKVFSVRASPLAISRLQLRSDSGSLP